MTSIGPQPHHRLALDHGVPASPCAKSYGLTFSRAWLVRIANETVQVATDGYYCNSRGEKVDIRDALQSSLKNSVHYHSSHTFRPEETTRPLFDETEFHVCYGSSLTVAMKLQDVLQKQQSPFKCHIGVLNSASGKRPEKFLRGTLSQEEGICRASLLYPCLMQFANRPHHFYQINQTKKYQDSSSSCAIFSPRVPVIREDSMKGTLLDHYETFSFVSIPAPNAFALGEDTDVVPKAQQPGASLTEEPYEHMTIKAAMKDRIFRALSIFAENGCTDLVLCAFGCGVHGNDPEEIALCFHDLLANELAGRFRTVCFAIHPSRHLNYKYFEQVFGGGNCVVGGSE